MLRKKRYRPERSDVSKNSKPTATNLDCEAKTALTKIPSLLPFVRFPSLPKRPLIGYYYERSEPKRYWRNISPFRLPPTAGGNATTCQVLPREKIFRIKIGRYSLKFDLAQFNSDLRALGKKSILNCQEVALLHDTEVPVRKCLSDNNFRRNSVIRRAKIVVAVGVACFQRRDRLGACSLSRRRDPRRRGTMLFDTSPRRFASPLGVESSQDEVASARVLEVASLVSPFPAIQECVFVSAVRTATLYEKACAIVPRSSYMLV